MSKNKPNLTDILEKTVDAGLKKRQESTLAKTEKLYAKYHAIFLQLSKRDLWTPTDLSYLLHGEKPDNWDPMPSDGIEKTITLIKRCLGQSLPNTSSAFRTPLIPRTACLAWWKDRVEPHPFWLRAIGEATKASQAIKQPKTAKATKARQTTKELRHQQLEWFLFEMDKRARAKNFNWDRSSMPFTKKDLRDVLLKACPDVKEFAPSTLDKDLPLFQAKCQNGTKPNVNNVLTKLFAAEIQVNKQR